MADFYLLSIQFAYGKYTLYRYGIFFSRRNLLCQMVFSESMSTLTRKGKDFQSSRLWGDMTNLTHFCHCEILKKSEDF